MSDREVLGCLVRETWVKWAREQPFPKPSWLVPWGQLGEEQREVDMRIGEAVAVAENLARLGVDPPEWDMYANALEQTPGVLPMLRACTTRAELDKLTEDGD